MNNGLKHLHTYTCVPNSKINIPDDFCYNNIMALATKTVP